MAPAYGLHDALLEEEQTIELQTTLRDPSLYKQADPVLGDYKLSPQVCWEGSAYRDESNYVLELSETEQQEIHQAIQGFYGICLCF